MPFCLFISNFKIKMPKISNKHHNDKQSKDADTDHWRKNGLPGKEKLYSVARKHSLKSEEIIQCSIQLFPHLIYVSDLTRDFMDRATFISNSDRNPSFLKRTIGNVRIKVIHINASLSASNDMQVRNKPTLWPFIPLICIRREEQLKIKNGILFMDEKQYNETKRMLEQGFLDASATKAATIQVELRDVHEALTELLETPVWEFLTEFKQRIQKMDAKCLPGTFCMELDILLNTVKHAFSYDEKAVSSTTNKSMIQVPEALTDYLSRKREVGEFFIWKSDEFWVFVKHKGKERYLEESLRRMYSAFFSKYKLNVIVGEVQLYPHLKQGDRIIGEGYGTLGGFVTDKLSPLAPEESNSGNTLLYQRESNATTREGHGRETNVYALTCGHICKKDCHIYAALENSEQTKIGKCVFSSDLQRPTEIPIFTDLALVQIDNNMRDRCQLSMLNQNYRESKVFIYREDLQSIVGKVYVYKIGATTGMRKGVIVSPKFYKDMTGGRAEMFVVSGIDGRSFSENGDSGSLVFMNDNSSALDTIKVIGMNWGGGSLDCKVKEAPSLDEEMSFCFRLDKAFHVLQEKGFDVCFENQL